MRREKCDVSEDNPSRDIMLRQIVRKLRQRLILYPLSSTPAAYTEPINGPLQGAIHHPPVVSCMLERIDLAPQGLIFLQENQTSNPNFSSAEADGFLGCQIIGLL
jgi:hypothetical protein